MQTESWEENLISYTTSVYYFTTLLLPVSTKFVHISAILHIFSTIDPQYFVFYIDTDWGRIRKYRKLEKKSSESAQEGIGSKGMEIDLVKTHYKNV